MFKFFQRLGKSLMLPVAALPVCGLLMGLGFIMCPANLPTEDINTTVQVIGYILQKAGGALIDNISWLFVIGVAVGMADDHDGTVAIAALASWLVVLALLNVNTITVVDPQLLEDPVVKIAFEKAASPFLAIIIGIISAVCYNNFKNFKTPQFLAFFSGKRFVVLISTLIATAFACIMFYVWPVVFNGIYTLGSWIQQLGGFGAALYALLNRLLLPFGLHHALNNLFWFDTIGLGDITHFWAGETSADVSWDLGMYMSGFLPCMMFGIAGAGLAFITSAKDKKRAFGIVVPFIACAFICGITEPFEFWFMFLSIPTYIAYAFLYGIITLITYFLQFRAGFVFSGGVIDFLASLSMPASKNSWLLLVLGAMAFVLFYIVFRVAIKAFKIKIAEEEAKDGKNAGVEKLVLKNGTYEEGAKRILEALGGKDNVVGVDSCATRLRLEVKDSGIIDEDAIKLAGALGVIKTSKTALQVVIGTNVQFVHDELNKLL